MPTITVRVDKELKQQMDRHPEINWSEVTRQAIAKKTDGLEQLERLEEIAARSEATETDVAEIAALVDENMKELYQVDESE